jgi:hypothetical protein
MKARVTLLAALASCVLAVAETPPKESTEVGDVKPLIATIAKADKVILHEGLPHPFNEPKVLDAEKKAKKTVTIAGWPFYAEPLELTDGDGTKLSDLLGDEKTYRAFRGEKKCGGFHPDYAVEWRVGKDVYYALICFGCSEFKIYGDGKAVRTDMGGGSKDDSRKDALTKLLKPYRKNRPER